MNLENSNTVNKGSEKYDKNKIKIYLCAYLVSEDMMTVINTEFTFVNYLYHIINYFIYFKIFSNFIFFIFIFRINIFFFLLQLVFSFVAI